MQERKMNAQVKAEWVAALRSGKYQQGKGALKRKKRNGVIHHCCLGVLLEVLGPTVMQSEKYDEDNMLYRITDLQDKGASFQQIAKHIEEKL
jgi:hypothetical protein